MWSHLAFSFTLMAVSAVLLANQWARREDDSDPKLAGRDREFLRRRFRRRLQVNAMIGLAGAALLAGAVIENRYAMAFFWGTTALLAAWILILAVVDAISTRMHFLRVHRDFLAEIDSLKTEFKRAKGNQADAASPGNSRMSNVEQGIQK